MLDFGREVCGNFDVAAKKEWLVTNGIGGFASGTIPGTLTRRYHGVLMAALHPPLGRTLLLTKLDERAEYDGIYQQSGRVYSLYTNHWASGLLEPDGYSYLDCFHIEGTTPVWTYAMANALLQKRLWMQPGANTTYIQYQLIRATGPLDLEIKVFGNYRDYHSTTIFNDWSPQVEPVANGVGVEMFAGATPYYLLSDKASIEARFDWYEDFFLAVEEYRGQRDIQEDHIYVAKARATLWSGDTVTLVATTEAKAGLDSEVAYQERQQYEKALLDTAQRHFVMPMPPHIEQLVLAADQFVVKRATPTNPDGHSIIAGYHWFSDWGRDTMIALPGLTLSTGRPQIAASILRTFAQFVDRGMLPNRFPDAGEIPEYNTVDATLWYFEAIRAYYAHTEDNELVQELFPVLADIVRWHQQGTRYNIRVDDADGLLYAGEEGVQLTWMDAKVDDWVVTPRIGKPVEINALWYNALCIMADFAQQLGQEATLYQTAAAKVKEGFKRFWNEEIGFCYDVLDSPDPNIKENDSSLRPNQLLAVSLAYSPLTPEQQRSAVDACARHLLTAHGLRSLSADDTAYIAVYGGDQRKRDDAYHQGTVWGWLIGPFVSAYLHVYGDKEQARSYLWPLIRHLRDHGVGSLSEIFDGNPPFTPRGCIAQAWSVAEVLRTWQETA